MSSIHATTSPTVQSVSPRARKGYSCGSPSSTPCDITQSRKVKAVTRA